MKKTKKILSLILAIIMIVSTVPMAFAIDIEYDYEFNFDFDALADACFDMYVNINNVYLPVENVTLNNIFFENQYFEKIDSEKINVALEYYYEYVFAIVKTGYPDLPEYPELPEDTNYLDLLNSHPEYAEALTSAIIEANKKIEANITKGDLIVHIDRRRELEKEQQYIQTLMFLFVKDRSIAQALLESLEAALLDPFANREIYMVFQRRDVGEILYGALYEPENYTQADYDLAIADFIVLATQILDCCKLIHSDYTLVNNTDGTHTTACGLCGMHLEETTTNCSYTNGKCICGAEEPIVEEDTTVETPDNNNSTTDNKEEPAPQNFFQKIINFFKNLFDKLFGWMKK